MQVYTFNAYLSENPPINRKLHLLGEHTLKDLHHIIIKAFHMVRVSKVGLYKATPKWRKKDKYALAKLPDDKETVLMEDITIGEYFADKKSKLIYECATFRVWSFNIELQKVKEKKNAKPSKYPDWDNPSGHTLNDYKRQIAMEEDEDDIMLDEDDLGEALKDFDNPDDDD